MTRTARSFLRRFATLVVAALAMAGCDDTVHPAAPAPPLEGAQDLEQRSRLSLYGLSGSNRRTGTCEAPSHRDFDFWVGTWDITLPNGLMPTSHVRNLLAGCLIEENFFGIGGAYGGRSMNAYDPASGTWKQTWMDNRGALIQLEGDRQGDAMVLTGSRLARVPSGNILPTDDTVTWTDTGSGGVNQFWLSTFHVGAQDIPVTLFNGDYSPNPSAAMPEIADPGLCQTGSHRALDFWVGAWTVVARNGRHLGESHVRTDLAGCLIEEDFEASRYGNQSFVAYDDLEDRWVRAFVDTNGVSLVLSGGFEDGVLVLEGETEQGGREVVVRMTVRPSSADEVVQSWYLSRDGGATWKHNGTVAYVR